MKRAAAFIVLMLLLAGCNGVQHNTELEKSISDIVENKDNNEIALDSLASFDWEKAFLFMPYSPQEHIEEQLGVSFNDSSSIDFRDDIYLLVFKNDGEVVQYAEVERQGTDFSIGEEEYLTPAEDVITIERP
ncbi:hypothetical protein [Bacillus sp. AG4(2022)]|uniref:hypothetical protein n=1 Tax=Bacillus sp. AG4(2022) TaxID=2962594 RepID=UPI002880FD71|nr:hypothetical protein [Bacillus sp. AG4(2022)]MDT0162943.1 hypothetical protein [Bacillus sp. AG4(2022)]